MPAGSNRWQLALLGAGLVGAALLYYASQLEPRWLRVRRLTLRLPRLGRAFHGYRIAHLSDIHMGGGMTPSRLRAAVNAANALQPDLVALTGDLIEADGRAAAAVVDALGALRARDGAVAVLGNHDYRRAPEAVRRALAQAGVVELSNAVYTLKRGADCLHIAGVDDIAAGRACLDAVLDALPPEGAAVLLVHEPDFADVSVAAGRFDLQLSGHTHAGQVRLPLLGAPVLPSYGRFYSAGLYRLGDMSLCISSGLGTIWPHVRFNARPEIVLLTLHSPGNGARLAP